MNIEVGVRLSHFTSNVDPYHGATLEVTDQASHARILTVVLPPEEFYKLMSSQGAVGTAEVLNPEHYEQRVGKTYVWEGIKLADDFAKEIRTERTPNDIMNDVGEVEMRRGNWQGYDWRLHNYGWSLMVWKYEATEVA